ncbi:probable tubulin polyglutamylase TTLL2 isoform X2 [Bombus vosnesenskii]|uniref:Probable tubulin polyglutamylase TTLL2 isoform X2 n=3 Tax=Pyrobombus TaxID=144703 RepID=A0A6J3KEN6_9HYME|nr:probable tubulin polyglutamylase TTLL2 isoform X2 [Bombus impatiens]XP_033193324.1 probable tubulin polyglutamylase TTLL2 isoform X2 [Bombus vancouverensis nearcticus]XP_033307618.1 probable tubulin polyglutamylase TTLL2 isoform X2 [Bombus bifarius]XP_033351633.1 probable tubulin polyglutamylase TTLL2 isoform X2 [Bombus vosnesenskii]XP_050475803.1 probable tubulin polyglutamylase TTLL2 isoform X2 [Bombus huntii]
MAVRYLDGPFVFRLNDNGTGPHLLIQVCTERGWREYTGENNVFKDRWNLWWRSGGFPLPHYKLLLPWQFINRIPKGSSICRKDNLIRHLRCMKKMHGSIYDFSPVGYNLPSEYTKLAEECSRCEHDRVWICKPVGQSQGKGIFLFRKLSDLTYDNAAVVQRYIENPFLIGGYKFDLRLYVCVPSYRPLTIYLYKEGLARFATEKFSLEHLNDPFRHLTNFSLNKLGPGYSEKKERVGSGCKWTFRQLRRYFEQAGYYDWFLWQRIACLVSLTVLSQAASIPKSSNCFEFFGFDVLIDRNLKPWLLEVNLSPALSNDCEIDSEVKKPLLHDLFDLLGLPVCNTGLSLFTIWSTNPIDDEVEASSKFCTNRTMKKKSKTYRETDGFLNICTELRPTGNNPESNNKTSIWDNGKDWSTPCAREGGWIRIYPLTRIKSENPINYVSSLSETTRIAEKETRNIVLSIQKYLKAAKEVHKKNEKYRDEQYNATLRKMVELNTEIWLPSK